ncbi:MAG: thermonuclease family protein [Trichloromonadaceae bacterium]
MISLTIGSFQYDSKIMDKWDRICPPFATFDGQTEKRYLFDFVEKALSPLRANLGVAPEMGMAYGQAAKEYVLDMAALKTVTVEVTDTDRYGRTVGDVILPDGRILNRDIVKAGYAWWFKKYSKDASLGELEEGARIARKGLWRDPKPIPPWEWRAAKKNGGADNSATVAQSGTATTASASTTLYHGNTRSGVFHQVSCKCKIRCTLDSKSDLNWTPSPV